MKRTLLLALAGLLLVPAVASAQARRGGPDHPFPGGKLPPGVKRLDARAESPAHDAVPPQAIARLAGAIQNLNRRVDRLEKAVKTMVDGIKKAHAGRTAAPARPGMRGEGRAMRGQGRAMRGEGRAMRGQGRAMRGQAGPRGRRPGAGQDFRRVMQHPRVRAFAQRMRGHFEQARPMLRRALEARQRDGRGPGMDRGRMMHEPRGPRGPMAEMGRRDAPVKKTGKKVVKKAGEKAGPRPAPGKTARVAMAGKAQAAERAAKVAAVRKAAHAKRQAPTVDRGILERARRLQVENAQLKVELRKLQAQVKKLMDAMHKRDAPPKRAKGG